VSELSENLFQVVDGTKAYGTRALFENVSFAINSGEHVGVIGPNGAGKSTLFKCLLGDESFDRGEAVKKVGLRIGYLAQHDDWELADSVEDYLLVKARKPLWNLKQLGVGLGVTESIFSSPMGDLNGGMRMRVKLLALLGSEPDLMLLDEPTNYLDLESLLVLENFLQDFKGAFLLISHDREFLRRTTDHILEIESGEVTKFNGGLDDYFEQKESLRLQLESRALSVAQRRKEILDFVNRFGAKASKARQAQSRLKSLEKMEVIDIKAAPVRAQIRIPAPTHCGKDVFRMQEVRLGYGDRTLISDCQLEIRNGEKVAVVGFNGVGKSTLLKCLNGALVPQHGKVEVGYQVEWAYFAQHVSESLSPKRNVLESLGEEAHPSVTSQDVLNMAGSLLFSGDDVRKKISVLSGGEKSRVALGRMLLKRVPVLILDEPTNHLDFQCVEALAQALKTFEGTVIFVSHDRSFVAQVATKIIEVNQGQARFFHGNYDDYVWSLTRGVLSERNTDLKPSGSGKNFTDTHSASFASGVASKSAADVSLSSSSGAPPRLDANSLQGYEWRKQKQRDLFQSQKLAESFERNLQKIESEIEGFEQKVEKGDTSPGIFSEIARCMDEKLRLESAWISELERIETLQALLKSP
jgi:ATP-binding cassette subfamily F protein 3